MPKQDFSVDMVTANWCIFERCLENIQKVLGQKTQKDTALKIGQLCVRSNFENVARYFSVDKEKQ